MKRGVGKLWTIFLILQSGVMGCGFEAHLGGGLNTTIFGLQQKTESVSDFELVRRNLVEENEAGALALLRSGKVGPYAQGSEGQTLVHLAARHGACGVAQYLIEQAHVPLVKDIVGKTPLHWAVERDACQEMVLLLLKACKGQITEKDGKGREPFSYVSSYSDCGEILLAAGASVDRLDYKGRSPLFYCTSAVNTQFLCSHNADVNRRDSRGLPILGAYLTYYFDAKKREEDRKKNEHYLSDEIKEAIKILLQYGATIPHYYHPADTEASFAFDRLLEGCRKERKVLLKAVLRDFARKVEEDLGVLATINRFITKKEARKVLQAQVYDEVVKAIPFFRARYEEATSFMRRDAEHSRLVSDQGSDPHEEVIGLLILCTSAQELSPRVRTQLRLIAEYEEFASVTAVQQTDKEVIGAVCLERLFPLQNPDNHTT